ncbi:unnamed protein product [Cuscuta campestris]|uniref:DUF3615 domain-containing protein n=1 Tax=Cuscuta campestris TaxID=132261 RepID=A0A484KYF5_9ASTE|nr:unnamed protein product [Cuscuta campestris]
MVKASGGKRKCLPPPTLESGPQSRNLPDEVEKELLEGLLHPHTKVTDEDKKMYMSLLRPELPVEPPAPVLQKKPKRQRIVQIRTVPDFLRDPVLDHRPKPEPTYLKNRREQNDPNPWEKTSGFTQKELRQRNLHLRWALAALSRYNRRHGTNYKLVEVINCNGFLLPVYKIWVHCAFKAATETSNVPELFFAEFYQYELQKDHFQSVTRITSRIKTTCDDCRYCEGKGIPHPVNKFTEGQKYYEGPILRTRRLT